MKNYLIIISLLFSHNLCAELLHKFSFQNNLDSDDGTQTLNYLDEESGQVTFHNQLNDRAVKFLPNNGSQIPPSVFAQTDLDSSIEFIFTMKLTDMGSDTGTGVKYLFGHGGPSSIQFDLKASQYGFDGEPSVSSNKYILQFVAEDGYDHRVTFNMGKFLLGEEVKVRLIIDFADGAVKLFAGQYFKQRPVSSEFDMVNFSTIFNNNNIHFGWSSRQRSFYNNGRAGTGFFDDLAIYSPAQPNDLDQLKSAAENLTDHFTGISILDETSLNENIFNLMSNYDNSFRFGQARGKLLSLLSAYEDNNPPLFELLENGQRINYLVREIPPEQSVMIHLHQLILDEDVTSDNVTSIQGLRFRLADDFSGLANPVAPRLNAVPIEINASYQEDPEIVNSFYGVPVKRPTGLYAAPGEVITITVPDEIVNAGLKVIVGAHTPDLHVKNKINRYWRVSRTFDINATETQVINPLGGGIYITVPHESDSGWITLDISGAVKSPYFSFREGRITPIEQWKDELMDGNSLWVDLESDKYMMTVPAANFLDENIDPAVLMGKWDQILDSYRYFTGRPLERARAEYGIADTTIKGNVHGVGYPQSFGKGNVPFIGSEFTAHLPTVIMNDNFWDNNNVPSQAIFHEMGHATLINRLSLDTETIVDIFPIYLVNAFYGADLRQAFRRMTTQNIYFDDAALDWMIDDQFRAGENMILSQAKYQARGNAKYIDFVEYFGWDGLSEAHKLNWQYALLVQDDPSNYKVSIDVFTQHLSEASGYNMAPLMHFWGFKPSDEKIAELASFPEYLPYLERLNYYQELIHLDLNAFQDWHSDTFNNINSRYARHFDEFDDFGYRQAMINQVKAIKALYYSEADLIFDDGFED